MDQDEAKHQAYQLAFQDREPATNLTPDNDTSMMSRSSGRHIPRDDAGRIMIDPFWHPDRFVDDWDKWRGTSSPVGPRPSPTPLDMARFCTALSSSGLLSAAARAIGVTARRIETVRSNCPVFDEACDEALDEFKARLHEEVVRRAVDGWHEPVFYEGELVGHVLKRSDRLLEGLVKGHMSNIFRERVDVNANVTGGVLVAPAGVAPADWQNQFGALAHGPLPDTKVIEGEMVPQPTSGQDDG